MGEAFLVIVSTKLSDGTNITNAYVTANLISNIDSRIPKKKMEAYLNLLGKPGKLVFISYLYRD